MRAINCSQMISLEQVGGIQWYTTMVLGIEKGKRKIFTLYRNHGETQLLKDRGVQLNIASLHHQLARLVQVARRNGGSIMKR
ncbi:hypothetical protein D3C84_1006920 [compost metagenome]